MVPKRGMTTGVFLSFLCQHALRVKFLMLALKDGIENRKLQNVFLFFNQPTAYAHNESSQGTVEDGEKTQELRTLQFQFLFAKMSATVYFRIYSSNAHPVCCEDTRTKGQYDHCQSDDLDLHSRAQLRLKRDCFLACNISDNV